MKTQSYLLLFVLFVLIGCQQADSDQAAMPELESLTRKEVAEMEANIGKNGTQSIQLLLRSGDQVVNTPVGSLDPYSEQLDALQRNAEIWVVESHKYVSKGKQASKSSDKGAAPMSFAERIYLIKLLQAAQQAKPANKAQALALKQVLDQSLQAGVVANNAQISAVLSLKGHLAASEYVSTIQSIQQNLSVSSRLIQNLEIIRNQLVNRPDDDDKSELSGLTFDSEETKEYFLKVSNKMKIAEVDALLSELKVTSEQIDMITSLTQN